MLTNTLQAVVFVGKGAQNSYPERGFVFFVVFFHKMVCECSCNVFFFAIPVLHSLSVVFWCMPIREVGLILTLESIPTVNCLPGGMGFFHCLFAELQKHKF